MSLFAAGFVCPCRGGTKSETNSRTCGQHATACGNKTASVKREGRIMELKRPVRLRVRRRAGARRLVDGP